MAPRRTSSNGGNSSPALGPKNGDYSWATSNGSSSKKRSSSSSQNSKLMLKTMATVALQPVSLAFMGQNAGPPSRQQSPAEAAEAATAV